MATSNMVKSCLMSVEHGLSNCGTPTTIGMQTTVVGVLNPLNAELNPICHLLALLGAHLIFHVSREGVKYKKKQNKQK